MEGVEEAEIWLRELPALVAALEREWEIETGNPYDDASSSWVAPTTRSDGTPAVPKDLLAAREGRAEIDALELWAGEGAVLSYATDRAPWAVLMERCEPGTSLLRAELDVD